MKVIPETKRERAALFHSFLMTELGKISGIPNQDQYNAAFDSATVRFNLEYGDPSTSKPELANITAADMEDSKKAGQEFTAAVRELMTSQGLTWNTAWNLHAGTPEGQAQLQRMHQPSMDTNVIHWQQTNNGDNTPQAQPGKGGGPVGPVNPGPSRAENPAERADRLQRKIGAK